MNHVRRITTIIALVLAAGVTSTGPAGATVESGSCTATPGKVSLTDTGKVRAGRVIIDCQGGWVGEEEILYQSKTAKWSYGGDKEIAGTGSTILPGFVRDYHFGCAAWRLRVELNGVYFNGPITRFCS